MSTFSAPVVKLKIKAHPNADAIEIAEVDGYQSIVQKGQYKDGDLAVYIPEQSVLSENLIEKLGLTGRLAGSKKNRVKAIKLRGVLSQGLICPFSVFEDAGFPNPVLGRDCAEILGITKYEPPVPPTLSGDVWHAGTNRTLKYDIENVKKWNRALTFGEHVVFTEKLHGCVPLYSPIRMANNSHKPLAKIEVGEYVLGVNKQGQVVPSKVLNKFKTGKAEKWLRIQGKRYGAGKGNHYFSLTCTPNHEVWSPSHGGYISADKLKIGDKVSNFRTNWSLTPLQKSVLLGKLLGDGHLIQEQLLGAIGWSHKVSEQSYAKFTANTLSNLVTAKPGFITSGYGTPMIRFRTAGNAQILRDFSSFISGGRKIVPEWVSAALDPIAVAFWYMDDGSLGHHAGQEDRAYFAVCGFTKQDVEVLQRGLKKFGITSEYYKSDGYSRLRLNTEASERLFLLIAPYVTDCMQHKLPKRYRGGPGWMPSDKLYRSPLVEQTISSIKDVTSTVSSSKWDLTTETHNFFANDVLVHNSWCCLALMPEHMKDEEQGRFLVTSKGQSAKGLAYKHPVAPKPQSIFQKVREWVWDIRISMTEILEYQDYMHSTPEDEELIREEYKQRLNYYNRKKRQCHNKGVNETNTYWSVAKALDMEKRMTSLFDKMSLNVPLFVLGEIFGGGIQDLDYGSVTKKSFRIFDVYIGVPGNGRYLDDLALTRACKKLGVPRVPVLYRGPFSEEVMQEYTTGKETVSGNGRHVREGIVIRPSIEREYGNLGRVQLKSINEKYLLRKGGTEFN